MKRRIPRKQKRDMEIYEALYEMKNSYYPTDVLGSYTGMADEYGYPEQDVDDL